MDPTPQEAQNLLKAAQQVGQTARSQLAHGAAAPLLILWGVVWIACFSLTQFAPRIAGQGWFVGDLVGLLGTGFFFWRQFRRGPVQSASERQLGRRMAWFWLALFLFADAGLFVLWPWQPDQMGAFVVLTIMFGYVVLGLWVQMPALLALGVLITVLTLAGFVGSWWVPGYFSLWLAVTGGGGLLAGGLFFLRRGR